MSEIIKSTNLFMLFVCFFFGHKKVSGHFTDGVFYWRTKCERCNAVHGMPKVQNEDNF